MLVHMSNPLSCYNAYFNFFIFGNKRIVSCFCTILCSWSWTYANGLCYLRIKYCEGYKIIRGCICSGHVSEGDQILLFYIEVFLILGKRFMHRIFWSNIRDLLRISNLVGFHWFIDFINSFNWSKYNFVENCKLWKKHLLSSLSYS